MRRWGPPLVALLAARALSGAAALYTGVNPLLESSWERWDSALYLTIAQSGYFLQQCPEAKACGNAGWFPLYAWLLRLAPVALLSLCFEFALLLALWNLLLRRRRFLALLLAAIFPGFIYQQAVFPISLTLLCTIAFLWMLRRRPRLAALPGALAAMSYPTGALLAPIALVRRKPLAALGVLAGLFLVLLVMRVETGRWDAYLLVQSRYAFGFAPVDALFGRLKPIVNARFRDPKSLSTALQTLFVLLLMALALRRWRRQPLLALHALAFWMFPLCVGGRLSLHRAESLLAPMVSLLPPRWLPALLLVASAIGFAVCVAFFRGTLV
jgi:hypothetical protein